MVLGHWNIPPPDAEGLVPDIALAPCLGWDGGYYDRALAALSPRPAGVGKALAAACLPTIYPQPHDIPLDTIMTQTGIIWGTKRCFMSLASETSARLRPT